MSPASWRLVRFGVVLLLLAPVTLTQGRATRALLTTPASAEATSWGGPSTPLVAGDASTFGESPPGEVTPDGRYTQDVPVAVPSFHGLEPSIGLRYDSRQGPGIAGWG